MNFATVKAMQLPVHARNQVTSE